MSDERILDKVQKLIDKAYGNTTDAEQTALLAKADELMMKYSIDQLQLLDPLRPNSAKAPAGSKPELREIKVQFNVEDYYVNYAMGQMFRRVAEHLFVRIGGISHGSAKCVGYPADLDFLEMFWLRLKLHMVSNLSPSVDPQISWEENLVNLKNCGFKWQEVHQKMRTHPKYPYKDHRWGRDPNTGKPSRWMVVFSATAKKWQEEHGGERNSASNPQNWRWDFISGYVARISERLREIRKTTLASNTNLPALLDDKKSDVEKFFWEMFPDLKPHPDNCTCEHCKVTVSSRRAVARRQPERKFNASAYGTGRKIANSADLSTSGTSVAGKRREVG